MKRLALFMTSTIILLLAIVLLVAPYFIGGMIKNQYEELLAAGSLQQGMVQVETTRYQRGWWHSEAETVVEVIDEDLLSWAIAYRDAIERDAGVGRFTVQHRLSHGPFILSQQGLQWALALINSEVVVSEAWADIFNEPVGQRSPLTLTTRLGWQGKADMQAVSPPLHHTLDVPGAKNLIDLQWGGLMGQFEIDVPLDAMKAHITAPHFALALPGRHIELQEFIVDVDAQRNVMLWAGNAAAQLRYVGLSRDDAPVIHALELHAATLSMHGETFEEAFSSELEFNAGRLIINEDAYGALHYDMVLERLDTEALANIIRIQREYSGPEQTVLLLEWVTPLLSHGLTLTKRFQLETVEGPLQANSHLSLAEVDLPGMSNPLAILGALQFELFLRFPPAVAQNILSTWEVRQLVAKDEASPDDRNLSKRAQALAEERLATLLQEGTLLRDETGGYTFRAELKQGAFSINGVPFQLGVPR